MVGVAALASAAASSLIPGLGGAASRLNTAPWILLLSGVTGVVSASYALAALGYGAAAFRTGRLPAVRVLQFGVSLAAALHLGALLLGVWGIPGAKREFDLTLASLLVLELAVVAAVGWRGHAASRRSFVRKGAKPRSALTVVGTLFAASVLVAAVTTPGLAASTAGSLAVPHSGHSTPEKSVTNNNQLPLEIQHLKNQGHQH